MSKNILVTTALPYANGSLHLGHILENLMADIWVRFLKMQGHKVYFFCADDTHGTAIMMEARKRGLSPEELIASTQQEHQQDFKDFLIEHTYYSSTHSPTNREMCYWFYERLKQKNLFRRREQEQLYCPHDQMFLPDRFVKGECPFCHAPNQYGDSCDVCGATYSPYQLISPQCAVCGTTPVSKKTEQISFALETFRPFLKQHIDQITDPATASKMKEWLKDELKDWDISRHAPYFGFPIPGETDQYFYVWLDAPMGYVSTSKDYFEQQGLNWESFWQASSQAEVYHIIGKDITYFHTLFWPALLEGAGLRLPSKVIVHGFVKVNGQKMSKSKGNFILARDYLKLLPPEALRYYLATKLTTGHEDLDFHLEDFTNKVNAELVGKIVNLYSRSWSLIHKNFQGRIVPLPQETKQELLKTWQSRVELIEKSYHELQFMTALSLVRELVDEANRYFDEKAPWKLVKTDPEAAHLALSQVVYWTKLLTILLYPVLPEMMQKAWRLLGRSDLPQWQEYLNLSDVTEILPYEPLFTRLDDDQVRALVNAPKE